MIHCMTGDSVLSLNLPIYLYLTAREGGGIVDKLIVAGIFSTPNVVDSLVKREAGNRRARLIYGIENHNVN